MIEESSPPERNPPTSTSATSHLVTASSSTRRSSRQIGSTAPPARARRRHAACGTSAVRRRCCRTACRARSPDRGRPRPSSALSSEANASRRRACEVERLDAERVARRDHAVRASPARRRTCRRAARSQRGAHVRNRCRMVSVSLCVAKRSAPELRPQLGVVVDLAVGDQHMLAAHDRLRSRLRADDREPAMRHHRGHARQLYDPQLVRPAMGDLLDHPPRERGIPRPPQAYEAAHAEPPSPRNAACPTAPASAGLQAPGDGRCGGGGACLAWRAGRTNPGQRRRGGRAWPGRLSTSS